MIPITDFTDPATIRLISKAYITEEAIAPLADDEEELEILSKLEGSSSARISTVALPAEVDPTEILNVSYGYGYSLINAAFCHARPPGNRFNSQDRGAWYCAFGIDAKLTPQAEIIFHRTRALKAAGCLYDIGHYRELLAGFTSKFHDLRNIPDHESLQANTTTAYPVGQALAPYCSKFEQDGRSPIRSNIPGRFSKYNIDHTSRCRSSMAVWWKASSFSVAAHQRKVYKGWLSGKRRPGQ